MLRFIARPQQYTLMPSVQLIHHLQAEQRDVINSETALTETTVNGKVSVLSVETTNHSCRMDKNAADMGVAVCAVKALQTYAVSLCSLANTSEGVETQAR